MSPQKENHGVLNVFGSYFFDDKLIPAFVRVGAIDAPLNTINFQRGVKIE